MISLSELKIIIMDKIKGKSDAEIRLDFLQAMIVEDVHNFDPNTIEDQIKSAVESLIGEGKLIIDSAGVIIDSQIG